MHDLKDVTFSISLKLDSEDRKRNLKNTINFLEKNFDTNIIVCENDKVSNKDFILSLSPNIHYIFDEDKTGIFKYTKVLNDMTKASKTPIVSNYDVDCLFKPTQIISAVNSIREHGFDVVFPYGGPFIDVPLQQIPLLESEKFDELNMNMCPVLHPQSVGGCIFFNKEAYTKAGLENENQLSWGFADNERITRMQILEMKIGRVPGYCYHMSHSRDLNGGFENPYIKQNEAEFNKVRSMNKEQLESYIKTWEWLN